MTYTGDPTDAHAAAIVADLYGLRPKAVRRFGTGNQHFVFEAVLTDRRTVVVRLSRAADVDIARGAVFWSRRLRPLGVPLPKLLHADLDMRTWPFPFIVLDRLPGTDLGNVYPDLTVRQRRDLACRLVEIQRIVTAQPEGTGFGFSRSDKGPFSAQSWPDVIAVDLERHRVRIRAAGLVDEQKVDAVERWADRLTDYLAAVRPTPFLHDITTKNVIVDRGGLSGIVDVDDLCFGDPLFLLALIRIALLAHDRDPAYIDDWLSLLRPDNDELAALDFYTAVHCVGFMGELGHRFNRSKPDPMNASFFSRLNRLHETLCSTLQ